MMCGQFLNFIRKLYMHTVTYVAALTAQSFPFGTSLSKITASLNVDNVGPIVPPVDLDANNTAIFSAIPDGTYTLKVQGFDGTGAALGTPYLVQVVVSDPAVSINLPTGGTVTIS